MIELILWRSISVWVHSDSVKGLAFSLVIECSAPTRSIVVAVTVSCINTSDVGCRSGGGESVILDFPARSVALGVVAGESFVGEMDLARSVLRLVNDRATKAKRVCFPSEVCN